MKDFEIKKLEVSYGRRKVLHDLSFQIPLGKITSVIGANGCGKSTLLKALAHIIPYEGCILMDGKNIREYTRKQLARLLSVLAQKPETTHGLRVEELVSYGRHPYTGAFRGNSKEDFEKIHRAMELTDIVQYKDRFLHTLSGGQRQKVWIALCLAQDTDMILLDEPTTYLDIAHQLEILEILKELKLRHQKTIVMVLHDINQAAQYSDSIIALKEGRMIRHGTGQEVITPSILQELFHVRTDIEEDRQTKKPKCVSFRLIHNKKHAETK